MATELKREGGGFAHIEELLGEDGRALLEFNSPKVSKDLLHTPGPDFIDRVWAHSDRSPRVLRSLQSLFDAGRLSGQAGCNRFSGPYSERGHILTAGALAVTRMACPGDRMTRDARILNSREQSVFHDYVAMTNATGLDFHPYLS